jgi:hypothetical protein
MQSTLQREERDTEKLMTRLADQDHRAFFFAAANKSQADKSIDSLNQSAAKRKK